MPLWSTLQCAAGSQNVTKLYKFLTISCGHTVVECTQQMDMRMRPRNT